MLVDTENSAITIEAEVQKDFEPDMFRLSVVFEGEKSERQECIESYNEDYSKVQSALVEAGILADEIKSSSFSVSVHHDWLYEKVDDARGYYRRRDRIVDGCEYQGACSVEREADFTLLAAIWNALQQLDGDFSFGIAYSLKRPDECEKELLRSAVSEARDRAEALADAAGSKLGNVKRIHYRFSRASSSYADGGGCEPMGDYCDAAEPGVPEFNPEPISVYCSVTLAWALE